MDITTNAVSCTLAMVPAPTVMGCTSANLTYYGQTHQYQVFAVGADGTLSTGSNVVSITLPSQPPNPPGTLVPGTVTGFVVTRTGNKIMASWKSNGNPGLPNCSKTWTGNCISGFTGVDKNHPSQVWHVPPQNNSFDSTGSYIGHTIELKVSVQTAKNTYVYSPYATYTVR
jgi:hypothetical protein